MEYNEDRESLKNVPTSTLPPPPRFDAVASAAARPVEPLATTRIQIDLTQKPRGSRLISRRSKFLALTAIVGLATGAAGGILVVESNKQQSENSASTIQLPAEQTPVVDLAASALQTSDNLEVSEPVENQVPVRRRQRPPRRQPRREQVVLSHSDDDEESDRGEDDDAEEEEEKDRKDDERRKNEDRERKQKDRDHDADSRRSGRNRALLYDVMRVRKP